MVRKIKTNFLNYIQFKLVVGMLVFLIPLVILVAYNNYYAVHVLRSKVAETNRTAISLTLNQIDNHLASNEKYLSDLFSTSEFYSIPYIQDSNSQTLMIQKLRNQIHKDINVMNYASSVFVYFNQLDHYVSANDGSFSFYDNLSINNYIKNLYNDNQSNLEGIASEWYVEKINNQFYLLRILRGDQLIMGISVMVDKVLFTLPDENLESDSVSLFTDDEGTPITQIDKMNYEEINFSQNYEDYYLTGAREKYLTVRKKSSRGDFNMIILTPDNKIISGFTYVKQTMLFLLITTLILLPVYLLILRKTIISPINLILSAMHTVKGGSIDVEIPPTKTSEEFKILMETFNSMVKEINNLKVENYEKQIYSQKVEYEHLQLQLKPHFYLNTLNIIYTLAKAKNYELLKEMAMCLIQHFRYMFRSSMDFVCLGEEIEHLRNYIRIQELRFPGNLRSEIEVDDSLSDKDIPPLIIHTFVENSIKYAVTANDKTELRVIVKSIEINSEPMIKILIQDNGKGLDKDMLAKLQVSDTLVDDQREHIGIMNVRKRLAMVYKNRASFKIDSGEGGGVEVEIIIPQDLHIAEDECDENNYS